NTFEFKLLLDQLLLEQKDKLTVLFNSFVCDVNSLSDRIESVTVANKDGLVVVKPKVVIDCTGDADVAAWAGAPFEQNPEVQPLTLHFRIANVQGTPGLSGLCRAALEGAQKRGELPYYYGPGVMFLFGKNEVYVHGVRVPCDPTNAADLTRAEMQGRADAHAMFRAWKKEVPAFADAYFMEAYPWIGVRESRRIIGQYVLKENDLMTAARFEDAIATGCWYLDLHPNKTVVGSANDFDPKKVQPEPYDIPFGSLVPQKVENLLVAGRCHSATRGAHASTRVTATAMALGEAAGCAAALALQSKQQVATLDGVRVREALAALGAGSFTGTP
ncbi:MAG: FAD-dependent oxidoreductase, partial [Verrucomicrobiales bacterium]|nr:FAD-dependent oxidoreductase [Verrucomicrobiales bacterium]